MTDIIIHVSVSRDGVTYALSPCSRRQFPKGRPRVFLSHESLPADLEYDAHCWPTVAEILTDLKWNEIQPNVLIVNPVTNETLHRVTRRPEGR